MSVNVCDVSLFSSPVIKYYLKYPSPLHKYHSSITQNNNNNNDDDDNNNNITAEDLNHSQLIKSLQKNEVLTVVIFFTKLEDLKKSESMERETGFSA